MNMLNLLASLVVGYYRRMKRASMQPVSAFHYDKTFTGETRLFHIMRHGMAEYRAPDGIKHRRFCRGIDLAQLRDQAEALENQAFSAWAQRAGDVNLWRYMRYVGIARKEFASNRAIQKSLDGKATAVLCEMHKRHAVEAEKDTPLFNAA